MDTMNNLNDHIFGKLYTQVLNAIEPSLWEAIYIYDKCDRFAIIEHNDYAMIFPYEYHTITNLNKQCIQVFVKRADSIMGHIISFELGNGLSICIMYEPINIDKYRTKDKSDYYPTYIQKIQGSKDLTELHKAISFLNKPFRISDPIQISNLIIPQLLKTFKKNFIGSFGNI